LAAVELAEQDRVLRFPFPKALEAAVVAQEALLTSLRPTEDSTEEAAAQEVQLALLHSPEDPEVAEAALVEAEH